MYSGRLNGAALHCLPYAIMLHLMVGCWIYSAEYQVRIIRRVRTRTRARHGRFLKKLSAAPDTRSESVKKEDGAVYWVQSS